MFFFFKQKTAYEMRISDWSSDVCSSDLRARPRLAQQAGNLVRLGRMMDGADAKAELPGDGQNRRDVARAIAMDVDADIAGENSRQRLQLQVARRHGACAGARLLDRALVAPGVQELLPHVSDDALPARRPLIVVRSEEHQSELQSLMRN